MNPKRLKMKKYILLFIIGFSFTAVQSQNITDAMRYAQDNLNGTARYRAMGGAFGALGGDLSALNVNPAGSAVFANNQFSFTLNNYGTKNNSEYFGTKTTKDISSFDLNQAGAVFVFNNKSNKGDWRKFTVGVNYENTNNFDNSLFSAGTNPTNSIDNYFLYYANQNEGVSINNLELKEGESISQLYRFLGTNFGFGEQQAFLGYQGFIIDPASNYDENNNRNYISLVPAGGNYYQENSVESTGYNGKLSFNAGAQYGDNIYFGVNLNSHFTDYRQVSSFYEENTNNTNSGVQRLRFENELSTFGTGFSFQLGTIAKVSENLRLGLSYESPTWYDLNDELSQGLSAVSADGAGGNLATDFVYPNVINRYQPYRLETPSKWTGSFAYIFGKSGLLSVDYAIKDYSNTKYKPLDDFRNANDAMANLLDQSGELRIGGEYRIKDWSLRGGYRMEQSPYKDGKTVGDLKGYSTGFGYNFGTTRLDLAYSYSERDYQKQFFSQGLTDSAKINGINQNVTLTLMFAL